MSTDRPSAQRFKPAKILGWVAIGLSILVLVASATFRVLNMSQNPPPTEPFDVRYARHQSVALLHLVPGMLFLILGSLQLMPRIRNRHIDFHRRLGRVLAACAFAAGVFGIAAAFRLPAFGGLSTQAATVLFGAIFLFSLAKAIRHIRRKQVQLHREWMIRTYALATGVASIRIFVGPLMIVSGLSMEAVFGTAFWLGWSTNLLVAEVWINKTRVPARRPAPSLRS